MLPCDPIELVVSIEEPRTPLALIMASSKSTSRVIQAGTARSRRPERSAGIGFAWSDALPPHLPIQISAIFGPHRRGPGPFDFPVYGTASLTGDERPAAWFWETARLAMRNTTNRLRHGAEFQIVGHDVAFVGASNWPAQSDAERYCLGPPLRMSFGVCHKNAEPLRSPRADSWTN
jgi:hypothetical protein